VTGFLLDTNVPSEMTRPRPAPEVERWLDAVDDSTLFISVISIAEILRGITRLPESKRHAQHQGFCRPGCAASQSVGTITGPKSFPTLQ